MNKKFIATLFILVLSWFGFSQKLSMKAGTNPTLINESAALEVESNTKGFLPPRMTNDEMKAIVNPVDGLIVYNTTLGCLAYYKNGSFNCTHIAPSIPTPSAPTGSTYVSLFNGITGGVSVNNTLSNYAAYTTTEKFSNNTNCATKYISAQGCGGLTQVTGASGTVYPLVNINGQCWFSTNLQEKPTNFASYTTTSWLNTSPGDLGYWGYYNTTTIDGSLGWATTVPSAGEGYLYQWNGAMNNSQLERAQGACPSGFHIPSDCEWMYLEHGLGMALSEQVLINTLRSNSNDNQGTPGYKMRSVVSGISYANASGFSSLNAGGRATDGTFFVRGTNVGYWTSSATGTTTAINRGMSSGLRGVPRDSNNKAYGFSVRCLKD